MRLHATTLGTEVHARLDGELTIHSVAALREELGACCAEGLSAEIDLSGVTDVDTAGLQWLLMAKRLRGCPVRFVNHSEPVIRMLELSNLEHQLGDPLVIAPKGAAR